MTISTNVQNKIPKPDVARLFLKVHYFDRKMQLTLRKRFLFSILLIISAFVVNAQKTQVYEKPEEIFYHGVELYDKEIFGPAIEEFERFLSTKHNSDLLTSQAELYVLLSHLQLYHQGYDKKIEHYINHNPENSLTNLATFELGNYFFAHKKYRKAAKYYEQVQVGNLPKEYLEETHFKMGYAFFQDKDYEKAKAHFNKIRNQQGEYYTEANYYYGYICYKDYDYTCALQSFEKIKDNGPQVMHLYIAQIYYAQGGYKASLEYAEKNKLEKYQEEYNLLLAKCHFQLKEYDKARAYFDKLDVNSTALGDEDIYMYGFAYYMNGNHDKAQQAFVKLSGFENNLGQLANYQLAQSFLATGDKQKAFNALGVAKRMEYNKEIQEIAHFNYAKLAFEQGSQSQSIQSTQDFINKFPKSEYLDDAKGMLAEMLVLTNNYEQAIRVLEEIKNFNTQSKAIYQKITYNRAEQLFIDRNLTDSKEYFNKSLKFTSDKLLEANAYYWLGEIDFAEKKYPSARSNYNRMINISGSEKSKYYHKAIYGIGYTHYMEEDVSKAMNYFSQYDKKSNDKGSDVYNDNALRLGDSYFLNKQYTNAIASYEKVASGNYDQSDYALFQQGIIYGLQGKYDTKVATLKKIESRFPKSVFVDDALFEIGDTYFKNLNKSSEALTMFNRVINNYSGSIYVPDCYLQIANIYNKSGDYAKSIEFCKKVITDYPNSRSAKEAYVIGEQAAMGGNMLDSWYDWVNAQPGSGDVRISYQDSMLYESSLQKYRMGDCDGASKGFELYNKRFGNTGYFVIQSHYYMAECAYAKKDYNTAVEHYRFVADKSLNEQLEDATFKLSDILYYQKRYTEALPYFSKLERIASSKDHYTFAVVGQMRCNYTLGNMEAAKKNASDVLPIENVETMYLIEANLILGKIQYESANYLTSMFHLDYVVKNSKTGQGAEAQYYRCLVLYKQTKYDDSQDEIFKLSEDYASYEYWVVKGFILLSDVYLAQKDYFQARATLQSLQEVYDGDQSLLNEIEAKLKKIDELEAIDKGASDQSGGE
ncbi:MAG: tetratricopeptide repeat protein [Flavobacteriales bacterium]|nr:tetratricopeptide repeat protein [Flavobacteriales bacterium]